MDRVATEADLAAVQLGDRLGRIHHRRQSGLLLEPALIAEAQVLGRRMVDLRHLLQRLAILGRHQFQPVEFRWRGMNGGNDGETAEQRGEK